MAVAYIDIKNTIFKIRDGSTPTANEITIRVGAGNLTYDENVEREYLLDRGRLDAVRNGDEVPMSVSFEFVWDEITGPTVLSDTAIDDAGTPSGPFAIAATTISVDTMADVPVQGRVFTIAGDSTVYKVVSATATTITFTPGLTASPADDAVVTFENRITVEDALKQRAGASGWLSTASNQCEPYAVDLIIEHDPICADDEDEDYTFPEFRYETLTHDVRAGTISVTGRCNATEVITTKGA